MAIGGIPVSGCLTRLSVSTLTVSRQLSPPPTQLPLLSLTEAIAVYDPALG